MLKLLLKLSFAAAVIVGNTYAAPETIHSVAHVKRGREADYQKLSAKSWAVYRKLGLVLPEPHLVMRGVDDAGLTYFIEVFTWKSADIPDHAPPEVRAIWKELEDACEPRGGRPGIDFSEVTPVNLK